LIALKGMESYVYSEINIEHLSMGCALDEIEAIRFILKYDIHMNIYI
jgi:hypothetical protein